MKKLALVCILLIASVKTFSAEVYSQDCLATDGDSKESKANFSLSTEALTYEIEDSSVGN